jgi:hypothetical protein
MINTVTGDLGRQLGNLALHNRSGLLGRLVPWVQSGTAGGDHDRVTIGHSLAECVADPVAIRDNHGTGDQKTKIT